MRMLGIGKGSEDRRCVFLVRVVFLWFMHVEMVTSALHDAKKQGLLGFVTHVLCGGESLLCVTRGSLATFGMLQRNKMGLESERVYFI